MKLSFQNLFSLVIDVVGRIKVNERKQAHDSDYKHATIKKHQPEGCGAPSIRQSHQGRIQTRELFEIKG